MSQEQKYEEGTRVLSEEELRDFDGTTIDEEGRTFDAPPHQSSQQEQVESRLSSGGCSGYYSAIHIS